MGEGGDKYLRGGGGGGGVEGGVLITLGGRSRNDDGGGNGPTTASPRPVGRGGEGSPEGDIVSAARPGRKVRVP